MSQVINIAVLDDHKIFLEGISILVEDMSGEYRVTNYHSPVALLHALEGEGSFDLIICDLIMSQMNGLAFVAAARSRIKTIPILMLSGINSIPPIREMMRLGTSGFVHKSAENETLRRAVQTVLAGGQFFEEVAHLDVAENISTSPESTIKSGDDGEITALPILGKRQVEVLQMIAQGASNKEISRRLDISPNTVKTHIKHIFTEMGVNKRTACVRRAQTLGML